VNPGNFYDRLRAAKQAPPQKPAMQGTLGQRVAGTPPARPTTGLDPISNMRAAGHAADAAARDKAAGAAQLAADKKAGGVGFLNALKAKFRRGPAPDVAGDADPQFSQQGLQTSKRFHGALPLQRNEKSPKKVVVERVEYKMSKGELALSKMGKCAGCSKAEHTGMCKGLSAANHNRTMLSVKPTRNKKSR
jgi:hypothetical protein